MFGHCSYGLVVFSGVPQRSALGPLFLVFNNDICTALGTHCLLYADGLKSFCRVFNVETCSVLQRDSERLV